MELMNDHTIQGRCLFPGAGFVEMALAATLENLGGKQQAVELQDVSFMEPFDLEVGKTLICEVSSGGGIEFRAASDESSVVCSVGDAVSSASSLEEANTLAAVKARCAEEVTGIDARYENLALREFHGPQFQTLSQVW